MISLIIIVYAVIGWSLANISYIIFDDINSFLPLVAIVLLWPLIILLVILGILCAVISRVLNLIASVVSKLKSKRKHPAYCESCDQLVSCEIHPPQEDTFPVRGVSITALQKHAYCPHCGSEVTPNEIIDFNVTNAHNAYLKKLGIPFATGAKKPRDLEE